MFLHLLNLLYEGLLLQVLSCKNDTKDAPKLQHNTTGNYVPTNDVVYSEAYWNPINNELLSHSSERAQINIVWQNCTWLSLVPKTEHLSQQ